MSGRANNPDLTVQVFSILRSVFFDERMTPRSYQLRPKQSTQDDPFDEHIHQVLSERFPKDIQCVKARGPLIAPDLVVWRPGECNGAPRTLLRTDLARIVALEVKKLERTQSGAVARSSGMDYNTTPPCGQVRIYDQSEQPLDIRGFYLFVCQEAVQDRPGYYTLTALALCDGNLLNADFGLYLSATGQRVKQIRLGTYGDAANRARPMFIFANPLGCSELDHHATLVHPRDDLAGESLQLSRLGRIRRQISGNGENVFHCYRVREDVPAGVAVLDLLDPFPLPERVETTQARGRFRLGVQPL